MKTPLKRQHKPLLLWNHDVGRTTDPVRMYMREMGTVELLTREGEIIIAKRIEEGIREVSAPWPTTLVLLISVLLELSTTELKLKKDGCLIYSPVSWIQTADEKQHW